MSSVFQMMKSLTPHLREISSIGTAAQFHIDTCKELEKIAAICRDVGHLFSNITVRPVWYGLDTKELLVSNPTKIDFRAQGIIPKCKAGDEADKLSRRPIGFRLPPDA